jgi:hypothetical protein
LTPAESCAAVPTPVIDADDAVADTPQPKGPGSTVLLVDEEGGFVAATAAEALAAAGWSVRIATTFPSVAAEVDPTQIWWVRRRLKQAGVEFVDSVIPEHDGSGWSLGDLESDETRPAGQVNLVVYAGARRSLDELSEGLTAAQPNLEVVRSATRSPPGNCWTPPPKARTLGRRGQAGPPGSGFSQRGLGELLPFRG